MSSTDAQESDEDAGTADAAEPEFSESDQAEPEQAGTDPSDRPAFDPETLVSAVTSFLLGETPSLTGPEVAEQAGISYEVAQERWRALGFPTVPDDEVSFTQADVQALRLNQKLFDSALVEPEARSAHTRTLGRTFARLADWQLQTFLASPLSKNEGGTDDISLRALDEIIPLAEQIQSYVWRRHLMSAASRMLLREAADTEAPPMVVGFADIVGYTARSRRMSPDDLAEMMENFEATLAGIITDHHGQVIKTIGDEVLFVCDDPAEAAQIALAILDEHEADSAFPQVHIGMAHGSVLSRLGDVYGPVVNIASRLTSIAKPARIAIDRSLADLLRDEDWLRIRRMRRASVRGYESLEPWSLKRPRESSGLRDTIGDAVEDSVTQAGDATRITRRDKRQDS